MHDLPHALLIDLLAAQDSAAGHGCGLDPRLCELLADRHAARPGTPRLNRAIRFDGPAPDGLPTAGGADVRR